MVFPVLILSVLTCLLVSMFFYDTTLKQCRLHQVLRASAGQLTGHTIWPEPPAADEAVLQTDRRGVFRVITGREQIDMIHQGILQDRVSTDLESLWHASDGVTYVRYCTIIRELGEDR